MKIKFTCEIPLNSKDDCIQSKTILTFCKFNSFKIKDIIIYRKIQNKLSLNTEYEFNIDNGWIGFILIKYYNVERKFYCYPLFLIDKDTPDKIFNIDIDLIKFLPIGIKWKQRLKWEDFNNEEIKPPINIPTEYFYLLCDGDNLGYLLTEDLRRIIL